jgi:hypothetical protein
MTQKALIKTPQYQIRTSKGSARKYPQVMWFPRSKTDPREIREVLKVAFMVQKKNSADTFNDKTLGETMAKIGSINVLGLDGEKYIEAYKGKSTGNISYITNARMLMRLFRFLGFVTRVNKGGYRLTTLGEIYTGFTGDFPSFKEGNSEEAMLLSSLANFTFYSPNDDPAYRDKTFKVRPFIWLLFALSLEPQCIYQLIVTSFASKDEGSVEIKRIKTLLGNLRDGTTDLNKEWRKLGLDPDDYSCVHNFYDSAKILVYLGTSLGLITKKADPIYGKKISGKARNLKQATMFYLLTEKGAAYLEEYLTATPMYYEKLYDLFGEENVLDATSLLAALNMQLGNKKMVSISKKFFSFEGKISRLIEIFSEAKVEIKNDKGNLSLTTPLTFNFWQSVPPEIMAQPEISKFYGSFITEFTRSKSSFIKIQEINHKGQKMIGAITSSFILHKTTKIAYDIPKLPPADLSPYVSYQGKEEIHGGTDRFPARISPTNSVSIIDGKIHVDNERDALDLLIPLGHPDKKLTDFIHDNFEGLINNFVKKSDTWEKDQHYAWVRNCFRLFGAEAIFSGSSGMLSRADVSISDPFIGGIEIKSPRENRGTLNTKAIRQAVDAKIQVTDIHKEKTGMPRVAIAIGRRVSDLAIKEEKKWASEKQPVLLLNDVILYYLSLKTVDVKISAEDLVSFFTENHGLVTKDILLKFVTVGLRREKASDAEVARARKEIEFLSSYLAPEE